MVAMPIARSTQAGIATGVVLLAAVAGFGIGVPKATGSASASTPDLPDEIAGYTALATLPSEQAEALGITSEAAAEQDTDAEANLSEQYGDASVRYYIDAEDAANVQTTGGFGRFSIVVIPAEDAALPMFGGPYESDAYELRTIDGHRCSIAWQPSADGAEPDAYAYQVQCRTVVDGLLYDIYSSSIAPDDVAALLTEVTETV